MKPKYSKQSFEGYTHCFKVEFFTNSPYTRSVDIYSDSSSYRSLKEMINEKKRNKITRDIVLEKSNFQESYEIFFKEWMKNIENEKYLNLDSLKPEVVETLKSWRNITDKIVLVTMRQNREYLLNQLDRLGILCLLNEVIDCPPQRKNTKYEALKDKIFNNAIFIGDTEEDTNTAKMLGIKSIGITNGLRNKKFLEADYYYEEIKDIDFNRLEINE